MRKSILISLLLFPVLFVMAQDDVLFPEIENYGGIPEVPKGSLMPAKGEKILIDMANGPSDPSILSKELDRVARLINLYKFAGVAPDQLHIKIVLHGSATCLSLSNEAYLDRLKMSNPNAQLLEELVQRGVEFYVCGQSFLKKGYRPEELGKHVHMTLSAMTTLIPFQREGYRSLDF